MEGGDPLIKKGLCTLSWEFQFRGREGEVERKSKLTIISQTIRGYLIHESTDLTIKSHSILVLLER